MKLQIIMPGKRLTVDLPDEECTERFTDFAKRLLFEQLPGENTERKPGRELRGYYLECEHCGNRRAFKFWGDITRHKCKDCAEMTDIDMDSLAKVDFKCGCGTSYTYFTNISAERFDMPCYICGASVGMAYDDGKERFVVEEEA